MVIAVSDLRVPGRPAHGRCGLPLACSPAESLGHSMLEKYGAAPGERLC